MMTNLARKLIKDMRAIGTRCLIGLATVSLSGCFFSYQRMDMKRGASLIEKGQFEEGFQLLERAVRREPQTSVALEAARRGSKAAVLEAKDYRRALYFGRQIVLYSPSPSERFAAQKQIAQIQFESLANYEQAIVEFNKLLALADPTEDTFAFRLSIAKAYYQLNNFYQAGVETDELLGKKLSDDQKFEVLLLRANIHLTEKKHDQAAATYTELLNHYPERAKKENVPLNLSVVYEEKGDFNKAIQTLEDLKSSYATPDFIDLKITRLKERAQNMPGAQGFRK